MLPGFYPANLETTPLTVATVIYTATIDLLPAAINYQSAPPGAPAPNDRYVVQPPGSGLWTGYDNHIAQWNNALTIWQFTAPEFRNAIQLTTPNVMRTYDGIKWNLISSNFTNRGETIAVINADATNGAATITLGSYDPSAAAPNRFTVEKVIATVTGGASATAEDWPLQIAIPGKAIRVALSGGSGYIRTLGKISVVPA